MKTLKAFEKIINQNRTLIFLDFDKESIMLDTKTKEIKLKQEDLYNMYTEKSSSKLQAIDFILFIFSISIIFYILHNLTVLILISIICLIVSINKLLTPQYRLHLYCNKGHLVFHIYKKDLENIKKLIDEIYDLEHEI